MPLNFGCALVFIKEHIIIILYAMYGYFLFRRALAATVIFIRPPQYQVYCDIS